MDLSKNKDVLRDEDFSDEAVSEILDFLWNGNREDIVNFKSVKKICEHVFETEESSFQSYLSEYAYNGIISTLEKELILANIEEGSLFLPAEVKSALKKLDHVYSYAMLAYEKAYY